MTRRFFPLPAFLALWLAASGGGCWTTSVSDTTDAPPPPQAKQPLPTTCPYGHVALRDTPVIYGLLMMTPELKRQIDNHEVVQGGCVVMPGYSPKSLLVCTRCRYQYNPLAAQWKRDSDDVASFERPLSPLVSGFPPLTPGLTFQQVIKDGRVLRESARCWTKEPFGKVCERIDRYLSDHGVAMRSTRTDTEGEYHTYQIGAVGDKTLTISTTPYKERGEVYVRVDLAGEERP